MKQLFGLIILSSLVILGCNSHSFTEGKKNGPKNAFGLKDVYENAFLIGTALNKRQINGEETGTLSLVTNEFNSVTAENAMKWERMEPEEGKWNFEVADKIVEFSQKNNMALIGHTLVWHNQVPEWVFIDKNGNPASRELLLKRMKNRIDTLLTRYKGKILGWDVVNEAVLDNGKWRESKWYKVIGEDYFDLAFKYAHEADPEVELYYNDYNLSKPKKRDAVIGLVNRLKSKGIKIDAVGMQGHFSRPYPKLSDFENSVKAFANSGVKVMVTELDISVLLFPSKDQQGAEVSLNIEFEEQYNPFVNGLSVEMNRKQIEMYVEVFDILLRHKKDITRVTLWGVHDQQSWWNNWPMKGRTDYPLLFDRDKKPKSVYQAVMQRGIKE